MIEKDLAGALWSTEQRQERKGYRKEKGIGPTDPTLVMQLVDTSRTGIVGDRMQRRDGQIEVDRVKCAVETEDRAAPDVVDDALAAISPRRA